MESIPDWLTLWRELAEAHAHNYPQASGAAAPDAWATRARSYHESVQQRWAQPDSSRDFLAADLRQHPHNTVVDIGAGTGAWAIFLARHARQVTAVDPSPAMLEILRENVAASGLTNITITEGGWPTVTVPQHDVTFCSHALYSIADFTALVRKMEATARRRCYLLLRVFLPHSIMAQASQRIWGQPYDSPNFQIAYNALLQLGIFANVLLEDSGLWQPWTNANLDEAFAEVKRRFGLEQDTTHDQFLRELLRQHLTEVAGRVVWPRGTRSALVYWDLGKPRCE